jgi:hypothetical protein
MAARTFITDSGGTERLVSRWFAVDSGGTARRANRVFVVDSGGTARLIFSGDVISISDVTAASETIRPAAAPVASYRLASDGDIDHTSGTNTISDAGDWITPKTNMALYECRATMISGTLTSGTTGSWMALSSDRTWTLTRTADGTSTASFTLEIRRASDGTVMDTATIGFEAARFSP